MKAGLSRTRRHSVWSLADTYGFISIYLHGSPVSRKHGDGMLRRRFNQKHYADPALRKACLYTGGDRLSSRLRSPSATPRETQLQRSQKRQFHDYFVTHLPSSSLHPDSRTQSGPHHKLPRAASIPHTPGSTSKSPTAAPPMLGHSRELTVVRIPLRSAKHHFGASNSRGQRPYNEDTYQAGTIEIPAFAKKAPISLSRKGPGGKDSGATSADSASGDPQIFYFGIFDGHGGQECSEFLKEELHTYIEQAATDFELGSSLRKSTKKDDEPQPKGQESLSAVDIASKDDAEASGQTPTINKDVVLEISEVDPEIEVEKPKGQEANEQRVIDLQVDLVTQWKTIVGGYFRRFKPDYFSTAKASSKRSSDAFSIEAVLMYAFLRADLEFVTAQASKPDPDSNTSSDLPLNNDEILGRPSLSSAPHHIGGTKRFKGGSTASIALISTPTPTPFWHPASPSTMIVAHVGDTRILLCDTSTGLAVPLTTNHHPSSPVEGARLRRYAATFVTDSFGEERMSGLANTRAFGDMRSKRIGVSAEPELIRTELGPAQYSFLVLMSDGVSGTLSDQEVVDVVKEAKTPEQGARDVVGFATEVTRDGDNATCLVVRLGGWERRIEGGLGSMATKEGREWRRNEAGDPRSRRT